MNVRCVKVRICIISNGIHRHTQIVADGLAERGHEVYLTYIERGDPFKVFHAKPLSLPPPKRFAVYERAKALVRILKALEDKIDIGIFVGYPVVHIIPYAPDHWVKVFMPITGPPTFHGLKRLYYVAYEKLIEKAIEKADAIVNVSNYMRKIFLERYGRDSAVIPPPVDEKFKPDFSKKTNDLILNIARFVPQKGQDIAVRMFKKLKPRLKSHGINARLVLHGMVGDKKYFKLISEMAKEIEGIILHGFVSDDKLVNLYQSATVFWWTIRMPEAFGMPPAEAMTCGTPVISFDQSPIREIVNDGKSGFIAYNEEEFIHHTVQILSDRETREAMSRYCANYAKRFSKERILDQWEALLSRLF